MALFGKASRGTRPGSLVLLTEEGAKAARTEGGFQVKKRKRMTMGRSQGSEGAE